MDNFNNFDEAKAREIFEKLRQEAEEILKDKDKVERTLQRAEKKLRGIPILGNSFAYAPVMISMVRSQIKKDYTDSNVGTIIAIIIALLYIVSPIDVIPDIVPLAGQLDDATVIGICVYLIKTDLDDYISWRKKAGEEYTDLPDYEDIVGDPAKFEGFKKIYEQIVSNN